MTARERVARAWHEGSDHAVDGTPFGGPLCNCWRVAGRMLPMLADAWGEGRHVGIEDTATRGKWNDDGHLVVPPSPNPYETEEDQ